MSEATAREAVRKAARRYRRVMSVKFFGGEPMLNLKAVRAACDEFESQVQAGRFPRSPSFGMVSNMASLPEGAADLIGRYRIRVTASIDGPAWIHDRLRPTRTGGGSLGRALENIRRLRQATGEPSLAQATYTSLHLKQGISVAELCRFIREEVGIASVVVALENPRGQVASFLSELPRLCHYFQESSYQGLLEAASSDGPIPNSLLHELSKLVRRSPERPAGQCHSDGICGVGRTVLVVTPEREIYPCYLFMGDGETRFSMGRLDDLQAFEGHRFALVGQALRQRQQALRQVHCGTCHARPVCNLCPGSYWREHGRLDEPSYVQCQVTRAAAAGLRMALAHLRSQPSRWSAFLSKVEESLQENPALAMF
jgi:uncharacterized protein